MVHLSWFVDCQWQLCHCQLRGRQDSRRLSRAAIDALALALRRQILELVVEHDMQCILDWQNHWIACAPLGFCKQRHDENLATHLPHRRGILGIVSMNVIEK